MSWESNSVDIDIKILAFTIESLVFYFTMACDSSIF